MTPPPLKRLSIPLAIALLLTSCGLTSNATPPLTLTDVTGKRHQPLVMGENRATVLFFLARDCPISNGYAPEMKRICADYQKKRIACYMVYTDMDAAPDVLRAHAKAFGYPCPSLADPQHRLVTRTGVVATPEVAVVAPDGKLLYRGRIDNTFARVGVRRNVTTQHDLRDALDAIVQHRPVPHPITPAIGCYIVSSVSNP